MSDELGASDVADIRVAHFIDERVDDPRGSRPMSWREFNHVRNRILQVCRQFGSVGAMDECPLAAGLSEEEAMNAWNTTGIRFPDFFLVDDQLNDERYIYIELDKAALLTVGWITSVARCLIDLPGWGIGISTCCSWYILLFPSIVLVQGSAFEGCKDINSVVQAAHRNLTKGSSLKANES